MTPVVNPVTGEVLEGSLDEIRTGVLRAAADIATREQYQLRLFSSKPDAVRLAFGGRVELDPDHDSDTGFVRQAELGKRISMRITACVVGGGVVRTEGRRADTDTLTVRLAVESIELEDRP